MAWVSANLCVYLKACFTRHFVERSWFWNSVTTRSIWKVYLKKLAFFLCSWIHFLSNSILFLCLCIFIPISWCIQILGLKARCLFIVCDKRIVHVWNLICTPQGIYVCLNVSNIKWFFFYIYIYFQQWIHFIIFRRKLAKLIHWDVQGAFDGIKL